MIIAGRYSFNMGEEVIGANFSELLKEVENVISDIDANTHRTKQSREKIRRKGVLYSPISLNKAFDKGFEKAGAWKPHRLPCEYPTDYYTPGYEPKPTSRGAFREMDFVKDRLGVEVQFGKYAFMVYNVCAKMTIFHNLQVIDAGVEIVPVKAFANKMSSGVSYFEQFVWDLQKRGVSNIDIPVLILGIDV
jgi:hypothetical protein